MPELLKKDSLMSRRPMIVLIISALASVYFCLRLSFAEVPLFRDEGLYAYIAQVMHDGGTLYVDVDDNKPPGLYMLYYIAQMLFGWGIPGALRFFAGLFGIASITLIYGIGSKALSRRAGLLASLYFSLLAASPFLYGFTALPEIFVVFFISAGYYIFLEATERKGSSRHALLALCGFFLGLAVIVKQTAVIYLLSLLCFQLTELRQEGKRKIFQSYAFSIMGFLLPLLIMILYLYHNGSLTQWAEYTIRFNHYLYHNFNAGIGSNIIKGFARGAADSIIQGGEFLMLLLLVFLLWLKKGMFLSRINVFLFFWLIASLSIIALLGVTGAHYFLLLLPPVTLYAGISSSFLSTSASAMRRGIHAFIVLSFLALFCLHIFPVIACGSPGRVAAELYHSKNYLWVEEVGRFVRERSGHRDCIYVWSMEWEMYFYSGRRSSSRHVNLFTISVLEKNDTDEARAFLRKYQAELIADLERTPPLFVIYAAPTLDMAYETDDLFITTYMSRTLREHYVLDGMIGTCSIYRRKKKDNYTQEHN
jgi:4-amino-4-deoxy-L-arabinose transferase-like glycosyltransferase